MVLRHSTENHSKTYPTETGFDQYLGDWDFAREGLQGSYLFSETNFQDFPRPQIDFSRALKFTLTPVYSQDLNVNSPYCLPYTSCFLAEFNRFPELSRFYRTRTNPRVSSLVYCVLNLSRLDRKQRHKHRIIEKAPTLRGWPFGKTKLAKTADRTIVL